MCNGAVKALLRAVRCVVEAKFVFLDLATGTSEVTGRVCTIPWRGRPRLMERTNEQESCAIAVLKPCRIIPPGSTHKLHMQRLVEWYEKKTIIVTTLSTPPSHAPRPLPFAMASENVISFHA